MVHRQHDQHDQRVDGSTQVDVDPELAERVGRTPAWTRRAFLGAAFAGSVAAPLWARQQDREIPPYEPRDWSGQDPLSYPDRDIIALDPRFRRYVLFNTPIKRLHIGTLWAEGPAWNGVGRYLVWSDIPNNVQLRWIADDGRVTVFRDPSGHSNGNTFDREGRQLSCEHGGRRVARYEQNGDVTVIADRFDGKRLNSPNDVVVHPDGSIWFTDPPYGIRGDYEGFRADSETPPAVYRVDPQSGHVALVSDEPGGPNGLCFSPDYTRLYVADTGSGRDIRVWDVDGPRLRNGRRHAELRAPVGSAPPACSRTGPPDATVSPIVQRVPSRSARKKNRSAGARAPTPIYARP